MPPRVVLVETSDALPGLLPFQGWDALASAERVYVRDADHHPAAEHLWFAGLELERLEPASLDRSELDLSRPGDPEDRRLAKALLQAAAERGRVAYLLGPDDHGLQPTVSLMSPDYDAEVEIVFLVPQPRGTELLRLVAVEQRLRDPDGGCPWDLEQDHRSLSPYLTEETHELLDAIDRGDDRDIAEELGDVLLQVVFHAQIATDRRAFTIDDVGRGVADKLVRRHPHVFAGADAATADEVLERWDDIKRAEQREPTGPFAGVPMTLPALALTRKLQRRAARVGCDRRDADDAWQAVHADLDALGDAAGADEREARLGDALAALVRLGGHLGVDDPEGALRRSSGAFRRRCEALLAAAARGGLDPVSLDAATWRRLWDDAVPAEPATEPGH